MIDVEPYDKLEFYWVCPPARYSKWKNRTAKRILVGLNKEAFACSAGGDYGKQGDFETMP
jgi:hypothetical protein